jgi:leader peptidase (prepilin peptidase)/N-methyltransferase
MDGLVTASCVVGGLILGDGLEVVVERVGGRRPLDRPWWCCEACGAAAHGWGLVPVVRGVARARPCESCGAQTAHPWRPAVLAVVSAAVLGGFAVHFGADIALAPYAVLGLSLVAISAIDIERRIIPNRLVYPTVAVVAPLLGVASAVDNRFGSLARAALAAAVAFLVFFAIHMAVPRGMGFGDVRLAGVVGMAGGWLGLGQAFVAFLAAFVLGALIGVAAMTVSGAGRKTKIPFGPFLAAGAVFTVMWGAPIAHALFHRGS